MVRRGYFDHGAFVQRLRRFGVRGRALGENLAYATEPGFNAGVVVQMDDESSPPVGTPRSELQQDRCRRGRWLDATRDSRLRRLARGLLDQTGRLALPPRAGAQLALLLDQQLPQRCDPFLADRPAPALDPSKETATSGARSMGLNGLVTTMPPSSSPCARSRSSARAVRNTIGITRPFALLQRLEHLPAVHARHHHVEEDHVRPLRAGQLDDRAVLSLDDLHPFRLEVDAAEKTHRASSSMTRTFAGTSSCIPIRPVVSPGWDRLHRQRKLDAKSRRGPRRSRPRSGPPSRQRAHVR